MNDRLQEIRSRLAKHKYATREYFDLAWLIDEVERLRDRVEDYEDDARAVASESCAGDEKHCTCVPHLRQEIERLRAAMNVSEIPCARCGGPCVEFVVPNVVWNEVVRRGGPEGDDEYICEACYRSCVNEYVLIQMSGKNSFRAAVRGKPRRAVTSRS